MNVAYIIAGAVLFALVLAVLTTIGSILGHVLTELRLIRLLLEKQIVAKNIRRMNNAHVR